MVNPSGNTLDNAVCEQLKLLGEDSSEFIRQLERGRKQLEGNREELGDTIERLRGTLTEHEKDIAALVSSLAKASGTSAEGYIVRQIDELHDKSEGIKRHIADLESLTAGHALSDIEFDLIRQMLASFKDTFDKMSVEEKRAALRTFVKKVVWDGATVHVYIFGADEGEGIDLPPEDYTPDDGRGGLWPSVDAQCAPLQNDGIIDGTLGEDSK
jgi:hypothetical protein